MVRRLLVCSTVCAVAFGSWVIAATSASAYTAPAYGTIDTIATNPGKAINGVATNAAGDLAYIGVGDGRAYFVPAATGTYFGQSMTGGTTYAIAGNGAIGYGGDNGPGTSATLNQPQGIAIDAADNVFIADTYNFRVRVVPNDSGVFAGVSYVGGYIYTLVGTGTEGYSGDGGVGSNAMLGEPREIAIDASDNLYIADLDKSVIRVWSAFGVTMFGQSIGANDVDTIAGTGSPGYSGNGGPATAAALRNPQGVSVTSDGSVLISDTYNNVIRMISASSQTRWGVSMTAGNIYTVAGGGGGGFSGDGAGALSASMNAPDSAGVDPNGDLIIADQGNNRVRAVAASTGTLYGNSWTANDMYTLAGNSSPPGNAGDGGASTGATLAAPQSITVDGHGNVLISSYDHVRIIGGHATPVSSLTVSSDVSSDTMDSTGAVQWTATVHNPSSGVTDTHVTVVFSVDSGTVNNSYYAFTNTLDSGQCLPSSSSETGDNNIMTCDLGSVTPNPGDSDPPQVSIQIQGKKLAAGATIHASIDVSSDFTAPGGDATAESDVTITAPVPGVVETFASGQAGSPAIKTDKAPSPTATIIAGFKIAKKVRAPGSFAMAPGAQLAAAAAPLVTNAGTPVSLQRLNGTSGNYGDLCTSGSPCLGDVMRLDPFVNQDDPKHPATLTLTWDLSVSSALHQGTLYIVTDSNPHPVAVPSCIKTKLGYSNTPCVKKVKPPTAKLGWVFQVLMLSSNDPSFGRR